MSDDPLAELMDAIWTLAGQDAPEDDAAVRAAAVALVLRELVAVNASIGKRTWTGHGDETIDARIAEWEAL